MSLYQTLDVFPEVPAMLDRLHSNGLKTAILSNGSPEMLLSAVEGAGIAHLLDAVLSVEEVGIYKPHPSVYQLAVDSLSLPAQAVCFLSSNAWDAHGASYFGFKVVWCNRYGQGKEILSRDHPTWRSPRCGTCRAFWASKNRRRLASLNHGCSAGASQKGGGNE